MEEFNRAEDEYSSDQKRLQQIMKEVLGTSGIILKRSYDKEPK